MQSPPSVRLGCILITRNCRRYLDAAELNPLHYLISHCSREALLPAGENAGEREISRFVLPDGETLYIVSDSVVGQTTLMLGTDGPPGH